MKKTITLKPKKGFAEVEALSRVKDIKSYGAYDQERAYITHVLESGEIMPGVMARVDASWFSAEDNRRYFSWIAGQFEKFGKAPSIGRFEATFPDFVGLRTNDAGEELIGELRNKKLYQEISIEVIRVKDRMKDSPADAVQGLSDRLLGLMGRMSETTFAEVSHDREEIKAQYEETQSMGGKRGIQWPWPILNECTPGILPKQYYVFYGPQGVMKTFTSLYLAWFFVCAHIKVGFISMEMSREEIRVRYAAQAAQLDYGFVETAQLTPKEKKRYFRAVDELKDCGFFIAEPLSKGDACVTEIDALMAQYADVNLWIIDGLGMIPEDSSWEANLELQKKIKHIARRRKASVIAFHHANNEVVKEGDENNAIDVAGGSGVPRYVDGLFRMRRTDQHREEDETQIEAVKIRNGADQLVFMVHAKPGITFEQKAVMKRPKPRAARGAVDTSADDEKL